MSMLVEVARMTQMAAPQFQGPMSPQHTPFLDCDCLDCEVYFGSGAPALDSHPESLKTERVPPCLALNATGTSMTCHCALCREVAPYVSRWTAVAMNSSCSSSGAVRPSFARRIRHFVSESSSASNEPRNLSRPTDNRRLLKFVSRRSGR
eukprot:Protomagalhaensia_wolfi_Nauph_80__2719@NODE_284_length_2933_cov_63_744990_g212_i0_p3_GENE_NODE_284_length_2933_cov_63_744990_g212_i0NODE_284_length_2933_cov_63_744990_g212_i0_p3_ORF_typecomplete_len150_score12_80DM/PF00751_18/3_8DM/PF00751_18/45_NODE_284_length_2933_cov_63_744990_g212_i093542